MLLVVADPESESPPPPGIPQWTYIPRDEAFAQHKNDDFVANTITAGVESLTVKALRWLEGLIEGKDEVNFENFEQIFKMYADQKVVGLENLPLRGPSHINNHPLHVIRNFFHGLEVKDDPRSWLYPLPGVVAGLLADLLSNFCNCCCPQKEFPTLRTLV